MMVNTQKSDTLPPRCPSILLLQYCLEDYHNPRPNMTPGLPYPERNKRIIKIIRKNL
jgi:hypothetical protein